MRSRYTPTQMQHVIDALENENYELRRQLTAARALVEEFLRARDTVTELLPRLRSFTEVPDESP